jgi:hypothetical protein
LVIIDSFRACAPSFEENSSEVRITLDAATRASEKTGCVFLFIHHARKPSEGQTGGAKMSFRGSSAFFDASGSAFVFVGEKGEPVLIEHEKCRNRGTTEDPFQLVIDDVDGRKGLRVTMREAEPDSVRQTAKAEAKAAERARMREESQKRMEEERQRANQDRQAKQQTQAQRDDESLLAIVKAHPGISVSDLRAEMAASLGQCGKERVETALARQKARLRVVIGAKNVRQHFIADGGWSAAADASEDETGDQ